MFVTPCFRIMKYVKAGKILKLDSLKNSDTKLINLKGFVYLFILLPNKVISVQFHENKN